MLKKALPGLKAAMGLKGGEAGVVLQDEPQLVQHRQELPEHVVVVVGGICLARHIQIEVPNEQDFRGGGRELDNIVAEGVEVDSLVTVK